MKLLLLLVIVTLAACVPGDNVDDKAPPPEQPNRRRPDTRSIVSPEQPDTPPEIRQPDRTYDVAELPTPQSERRASETRSTPPRLPESWALEPETRASTSVWRATPPSPESPTPRPQHDTTAVSAPITPEFLAPHYSSTSTITEESPTLEMQHHTTPVSTSGTPQFREGDQARTTPEKTEPSGIFVCDLRFSSSALLHRRRCSTRTRYGLSDTDSSISPMPQRSDLRGRHPQSTTYFLIDEQGRDNILLDYRSIQARLQQRGPRIPVPDNRDAGYESGRSSSAGSGVVLDRGRAAWRGPRRHPWGSSQRQCPVPMPCRANAASTAAGISGLHPDHGLPIIYRERISFERLLRAVRNYDARLPCGQGKIFLDGPDAYVLWVKDDEKFVYRFPNEDTLAKSLNPNNIYGTSCIDADHCYDDTSLFIPKVGDKDAGIYRCRVHYQGSSSVDYVIDLHIVEATGTPKILDEKGEQIISHYVGPLTLGSNLTIICEVVISEPPTTVLWLRNGVTIRRIVSDKPGILREKVEIVNATRNELDAHYQCTASNADVTEAMAASVVVKMYLPPLKLEIRLNDNLNFEVGQPRVVDCVVVGCFPTPAINWYLGGTLLKASAHKELHDGNYTVSSLTLTASMRDNKKWLSCRVHNAYLPTIYEDNVTLHVSHRPTCDVSLTRVISIRPGSIEEITCTVISPEQPRQFRWVFSNSRVIFSNPMALHALTNSYTTVLSWVPSVADLGRLECHIITDFGEQRDFCLFNLVHGEAPEPPICIQQELSQAENIQLACEASWSGERNHCIHIEVRNSRNELLHNDSNTSGYFTLPKFVGTDNLTATVYSETSRGKSSEQKFPLNTTSTIDNNGNPQSIWQRSIITSAVSGVAVASAAAGIYTLLSRRRESRHDRLEAEPGGIGPYSGYLEEFRRRNGYSPRVTEAPVSLQDLPARRRRNASRPQTPPCPDDNPAEPNG